MPSYRRLLSLLLSGGAALAVMTGSALAAVQGTLGATSTGSVTINVTKPARASINNLNDLSIPSYIPGAGNQTLTDDVCVYSSRPNGGYTITATGSGTGGAYTLANATNKLPYQVTWNAGGVGALTNTGTALQPGVTSPSLSKAATDSSNCTGAVPGMTARLIVSFLATDLDAIVDGTYTGTLTLLVTPV